MHRLERCTTTASCPNKWCPSLHTSSALVTKSMALRATYQHIGTPFRKVVAAHECVGTKCMKRPVFALTSALRLLVVALALYRLHRPYNWSLGAPRDRMVAKLDDVPWVYRKRRCRTRRFYELPLRFRRLRARRRTLVHYVQRVSASSTKLDAPSLCMGLHSEEPSSLTSRPFGRP